MWYAVQVKTGREEITVDICKKLISSKVLKQCFIPKYEQKKKYEGKWHIIQQILFPGYVFMITENVISLFNELKNVPKLTKILGYENDNFIALKDDEVNFMTRFQDEKHVVRISFGYVIGDEIVIQEGPLKGFEGKIKKIDRHKRIAVIEVKLFGRVSDVTIGLEIIRKC